MVDYNKLIPELKDWNEGDGIDVESWIGSVGDFRKAVGYSALFWPAFVEMEGCVVRGDVSPEDVREWMEHLKGDRRGVEATVNHLHIVDLHNTECGDATPERLSHLGRVLREMYECKLMRDFPDRTFVVRFDEPDPGDDLTDYVLTFCQKE
jgi:hypothetical protein